MPKIAYVGDFFPFLDPLHTIKTFSTRLPTACPAAYPAAFPLDFPQEFDARFSRKNFPQDFPTRFSRKNFMQDFPTRISCKIFPQYFSTRFSHKNFPARFSCKNFPQDFLELDPDWLAPHHPIPNAKFPPIAALLNRPTYHKRSKESPPTFPQILWEPQINE